MSSTSPVFEKEKILSQWYSTTEMALGLSSVSSYSQFTPYESLSLVKISSKPMENDSNHMIRGDALVSNCSTLDFLNKIVTQDLKERQQFDEKTKQMAEMENWKDTELYSTLFSLNRHEESSAEWFIRYMLVGSPSLMVSDRDFVSIERFCYLSDDKKEDGVNRVSILSSTSVSKGELSDNDKVYWSEKTPKPTRSVRGDNIVTFFKFEELESGDLRITFLGQTNANGWIMPSIANQVIFNRPLNLEGIAKLLNKSLKKVDYLQ